MVTRQIAVTAKLACAPIQHLRKRLRSAPYHSKNQIEQGSELHQNPAGGAAARFFVSKVARILARRRLSRELEKKGESNRDLAAPAYGATAPAPVGR
jgi:hypothetical protein